MTDFTFKQYKTKLAVMWEDEDGEKCRLSMSYSNWKSLQEVRDHEWTHALEHWDNRYYNQCVHKDTVEYVGDTIDIDLDVLPSMGYCLGWGDVRTKAARLGLFRELDYTMEVTNERWDRRTHKTTKKRERLEYSTTVWTKLGMELIEALPNVPDRDKWADRAGKEGIEKLTPHQIQTLKNWPMREDEYAMTITPEGQSKPVKDASWTTKSFGGGGKTIQRLLELGLAERGIVGVHIDKDGNLQFDDPQSRHMTVAHRITIMGALYR